MKTYLTPIEAEGLTTEQVAEMERWLRVQASVQKRSHIFGALGHSSALDFGALLIKFLKKCVADRVGCEVNRVPESIIPDHIIYQCSPDEPVDAATRLASALDMEDSEEKAIRLEGALSHGYVTQIQSLVDEYVHRWELFMSPCNSAHGVLDYLYANDPRFVSMTSAVKASFSKENNPFGILGTTVSCQSIYPTVAQQSAGADFFVAPSDEQVQLSMSAIYPGLKAGDLPLAKKELEKALRLYKNRGVEKVYLLCTDLPCIARGYPDDFVEARTGLFVWDGIIIEDGNAIIANTFASRMMDLYTEA